LIENRTSIAAAAASVAVLAGVASAADAPSPRAETPRLVGGLARPGFATAVGDPSLLWSPDPRRGLQRVRSAGARSVRLILSWSRIAPAGPRRPARFDAANPSDPHYRWKDADRMIRLIVRQGLEPIVCILDAPQWAEDERVAGPPGTRRPDPDALGLFARALATRYSGGFARLPRVRYWQIWNEPNYATFLTPQGINGKAVSPAWYRRMLNEAAAGIRAAQPDAIVVGGSLAPTGSRPVTDSVAPLQFVRQLLCVSGGRRPRATCTHRAAFDVWSQHPYTSGGPGLHAGSDNVWVADLPRVRRLLVAAAALGHVTSPQPPRLWVTEFGWDSKPPDPAAVPQRLLARWVSEALYRMWRSGVSLVTWYQLRDGPLGQGGLYFDDGTRYRLNRPKLALAAFRFPFVAYRSRGRVFVWGRAPHSFDGEVLVEQRLGRGPWQLVDVARSDDSGVFTGRLRAPARASLRARVRGRSPSLPFWLGKPRGVVLTSPFGS
jgi:hypothetical protein